MKNIGNSIFCEFLKIDENALALMGEIRLHTISNSTLVHFSVIETSDKLYSEHLETTITIVIKLVVVHIVSFLFGGEVWRRWRTRNRNVNVLTNNHFVPS